MEGSNPTELRPDTPRAEPLTVLCLVCELPCRGWYEMDPGASENHEMFTWDEVCCCDYWNLGEGITYRLMEAQLRVEAEHIRSRASALPYVNKEYLLTSLVDPALHFAPDNPAG